MSDNEYKIDITGDPAGLKQAGKQSKDELKGIQGAADDALDKIYGIGQAGKKTGDALEETGKRGKRSLLDLQAAVSLVTQGLNMARQAAALAADGIQKAAEKQKGNVKGVIDEQNRLREVATLLGVRANSKFAIDQQKFNVSTAMTPEEGLGFRTQFLNSGVQFKGSSITNKEFEQFEQQAASLAAAKGFDPEQAGDFAGTVLGFKDRSGMGDKGSEDALGKFNSGLSIVGAGKGRTSVLMNQLSMLSSAALNEDQIKGVFQDSDEVATVISVAAEKHDAQAAEMGKAAIRAIRSDDRKVAELRAKAGITSKTPFIESMKRIQPYIEADAKANGDKISDALGRIFESDIEKDALEVFLNKGVSGGIFDARAEFAKGVQGEKPALDEIANFQSAPDEAGVQRIAEGRKRLAEMQAGQAGVTAQALRGQAQAEMQSSGFFDSSNQMYVSIRDKIGLGLRDTTHDTENIYLANILKRRAAAGGMDLDTSGITGSYKRENQDAAINAAMEQMTKAGINPAQDSPQAQALNAHLERMNATLDKMAAQGGMKPPAAGPGAENAPSLPPPLKGAPEAWQPR